MWRRNGLILSGLAFAFVRRDSKEGNGGAVGLLTKTKVMNEFISRLNGMRRMDPALVSSIERSLVRLEFGKEDLLIKDEQTPKYIYFVKSGLIAEYFQSEDKHIYTNFWSSNGIIYDSEYLLEQKPGCSYLMAEKKSIIFALPYDRLQSIRVQYPEFNIHLEMLSIKNTQEQADRLGILEATADMEKIKKFLAHFGEMATRIPGDHIISYLGLSANCIKLIIKVERHKKE